MTGRPEQASFSELQYLEEQLRALSQTRLGVDGPAAGGKGTLNQSLQSRLGLAELPTGDMYRAATYFLLEKFNERVTDRSDDELRQALAGFDIQFQFGGGTRNILVPHPLTGQVMNVSDRLQDPAIGERVSAVAKRDPVRDILEEQQRTLVELSQKIVAEGRDMWKILKGVEGIILIYLYANDETLIAREIERHQKLGRVITPEKARELTVVRNKADNTRTRGQLLLPHQVLPGGEYENTYDFVVNTSLLTAEAVYEKIVRFIHRQYFSLKG